MTSEKPSCFEYLKKLVEKNASFSHPAIFQTPALKLFVLFFTSQPGPGAAQKSFDELTSPIWTFYVTQSFLSL